MLSTTEMVLYLSYQYNTMAMEDSSEKRFLLMPESLSVDWQRVWVSMNFLPSKIAIPPWSHSAEEYPTNVKFMTVMLTLIGTGTRTESTEEPVFEELLDKVHILKEGYTWWTPVSARKLCVNFRKTSFALVCWGMRSCTKHWNVVVVKVFWNLCVTSEENPGPSRTRKRKAETARWMCLFFVPCMWTESTIFLMWCRCTDENIFIHAGKDWR